MAIFEKISFFNFTVHKTTLPLLEYFDVTTQVNDPGLLRKCLEAPGLMLGIFAIVRNLDIYVNSGAFNVNKSWEKIYQSCQ